MSVGRTAIIGRWRRNVRDIYTFYRLAGLRGVSSFLVVGVDGFQGLKHLLLVARTMFAFEGEVPVGGSPFDPTKRTSLGALGKFAIPLMILAKAAKTAIRGKDSGWKSVVRKIFPVFFIFLFKS